MIRNSLKSLLRKSIMTVSGPTVPVVAGPLKGMRLLRSHTDQLSMLFGTYEKTFATAFHKRTVGAEVIYDVGANAGYFSLMAAHNCSDQGTVVAFEPVEEIVDSLKELVECNKLSERVTTVNAALVDKSGPLRLYTPASDKSGVIESAMRHADIEKSDFVEVEGITLDDFVLQNRNPIPDVIKIDVEGAEASVLAGAQKLMASKHPTILLEVHGCQPAADVWDLTAHLNYDLRLLTDSGEVLIPDRETWLSHFSGSKWIIHHCVLEQVTAASNAA